MKYIIILLLCFPLFAIAQGGQKKELPLNDGQEMEFKAGHESSDCNGKGESYYLGDYRVEKHLDCQGFGNKCVYKIKADIVLYGGSVELAMQSGEKQKVRVYFITPFTDKEFYMPARSIYCKTQAKYMNFPALNISRGVGLKGKYYTSMDVSFTDKPLHENK